MWKQPRIVDLRPADSVIGFFVVRKKQIRTQKESNDPYLFLELGDASGRIGATLWEQPKEWYQEISEGEIVKVQGTVMEFQDRLMLRLKRIRRATPEDPLSEVDLLPRSQESPEMLFQRLLAEVERITDPPLRALVLETLSEPRTRERFLQAPAGKLWHHTYLGGLLEHTLSVLQIADFLSGHYEGIDRQLLRAGAILHDVGKAFELEASGFIDYSDAGRLLGHITIGVRLVHEAAARVTGLTENRLNQVLHLILSHHGEPEKGSPVKPATLEAVLLHYADEIDSRVAGIQRIIEREEEPGRRWSSYVKLLDRHIYLGEKE
ncbi:MAG: HD domain-containing protein [candidate division KSB1 bacterium]|nr:HD domain-containing protein [candidate division KSB1 bacterium]